MTVARYIALSLISRYHCLDPTNCDISGLHCTYLQFIKNNSLCLTLWPSYTIWWYRSAAKLAHVMMCFLTASSHYPNQCWHIRSLAFTQGQFHRKYARYLSLIWIWKWLIQDNSQISQGPVNWWFWIWPVLTNSMGPGRVGCNIVEVIVKHNLVTDVFQYFLWNCPLVNVT